jgi:hypothetical protein
LPFLGLFVGTYSASAAVPSNPDQRFRVQAEVEDRGFSGLFLGTYSALPYAAPCRVAPRTRPVSCGFAVEASAGWPVHRAAQAMPYAGALIKARGRFWCASQLQACREGVRTKDPIHVKGRHDVLLSTAGPSANLRLSDRRQLRDTSWWPIEWTGSPRRSQLSWSGDRPQRGLESSESWCIQLRSPLVNGVFGGGFCRGGAIPPPLGEQQQLGACVGQVRLPHDISVGDEVTDDLRRSLLGDPEVLAASSISVSPVSRGARSRLLQEPPELRGSGAPNGGRGARVG